MTRCGVGFSWCGLVGLLIGGGSGLWVIECDVVWGLRGVGVGVCLWVMGVCLGGEKVCDSGGLGCGL